MIRQLEYLDNDGNRVSYAYEYSAIPSGYTPNVNINYLDDTDYLFDPDNGYIDSTGNATEKMYRMLKRIERVNGSTWEFVVTDVTRLDKKSLRGGKSRAIPTYYDQSGDSSTLITGIGDLDDCEITRVDQERNPDIMSRDLFISTMPGFSATLAGGSTNEIDYSSILNPVNETNVNNYYPVLQHGYFYSGGTEYYMYGNKQSEIIAGENAYVDSSGLVHYVLSGQPNEIAPVMANMQSGLMSDLMSTIEISDYAVYNNNTYRARFEGSIERHKHQLATLYPWVYIVEDTTREIHLPDVDIITLNEIRATNDVNLNGYINVIRPNRFFRTFPVSNPQSYSIAHNLGTTDIFTVINYDNDLIVPYVTIVDENTILVTADGIYGNIMVIDTSRYTYSEVLSGVTSATVTHNLDLPINSEEPYYVDPWVFAIDSNNDITVADTSIVDKDSVYLDFYESFTGTVYVLDFATFNETGALEEGTSFINTDHFAFEEGEFAGNFGLATPFHLIDPIPSGQYVLISQDRLEEVRELNFVSGYYSEDIPVSHPVYYTTENEIVIPSGMAYTPSGTISHAVITYEKERSEAYEFRFRGTDISPVTWYNTDRVVAIQIEQGDVENVELIPDENNIRMQDTATRVIGSTADPQLVVYLPGRAPIGEPITNMNITSFATDDAEVAISGQLLLVDTQRPLYEADGTEINEYNIDIVDNTSGLFQLPSSLTSGLLTNEPLTTLSIFDEITFDDIPIETIPIFDNNGYLFTTMSGLSTYRVPFQGSLYDQDNDKLSHTMYATTDVFGTAINTVGFHNNPLQKTVRKLHITSSVSGDSSVYGATDIIVYPIERADTYGVIDSDEIPNLFISTAPLDSSEASYISGIIPTLSTMHIHDTEDFNTTSGIVDRVEFGSGIIDTYQVGSGYFVWHESRDTSDMLRYDEVDFMPTLLDNGEYYGSD